MSTCTQGPIPREGSPAWEDSGLLAGVTPSMATLPAGLGLEALCCHTHVCIFNIPGGSRSLSELLVWDVLVISLGINYSSG